MQPKYLCSEQSNSWEALSCLYFVLSISECKSPRAGKRVRKFQPWSRDSNNRHPQPLKWADMGSSASSLELLFSHPTKVHRSLHPFCCAEKDLSLFHLSALNKGAESTPFLSCSKWQGTISPQVPVMAQHCSPLLRNWTCGVVDILWAYFSEQVCEGS